MTQTEFAAHRGVQKSAVSNWKTAGHLIWAEEPGTGRMKIDVQRTEARLNARIDPTRGRPTTGQAQGALFAQPASGPEEGSTPASATRDTTRGGDDLSNVRTDLLREQMLGKRFENAEKAKTLVPVVEFETRATTLARVIRERMHGIARRSSERLAAERDPRTITLVLGEMIDKAFSSMADQLEFGGDLVDDEDDAALNAELAATSEEEAEPDIAEVA